MVDHGSLTDIGEGKTADKGRGAVHLNSVQEDVMGPQCGRPSTARN